VIGTPSRWTTTALYACTLAIAGALPFESIHPLVAVPWFVLTSVEVLVGVSAVCWTAHLIQSRVWPDLTGPLTRPVLLFLTVGMASALLAPTFQLDALKFVGRLATGAFVAALTASVCVSHMRFQGILWAISLGAGLSMLAGLGEVAGWQALDPLLACFKVAPTRVGGELRASATFQYATIAAAFFAMAIPLIVAAAAATMFRPARLLASGIAALGAFTIIFTLTRAAIVALLAIIILMLGLGWRWPRWRVLRTPASIALLGMVIGLAFLLPTGNVLTRLATEDDRGWYDATYEVPSTLEITSGDQTSLVVHVHNTGQAVWHSGGPSPFRLGYRWLSADGQLELASSRTEFDLPREVRPGESIAMAVQLQAPWPAGEYRVAWSMLQHNILWFHHRGVREAETVTVVTSRGEEPAPASPTTVAAPEDVDAMMPVLSRSQLWRAAVAMVLERPLFGFGPDTFRRLHGRYLGLSQWNQNIYANNLYLELLATTGIAGLAAFSWLILAALRSLARVLTSSTDRSVSLWSIGIGASLLVFLLHGFLDYFLWSTSVSLLFWMLLGLTIAVTRLVRSSSPASGL
jgi:hypothetical protein